MDKSILSGTGYNTNPAAPITGGLLLTLLLSTSPAFAATDSLPELDCVIEPSEVVDIGSATAGVLETVAYDRGDLVSKNEVVARLESSTEKAAAELARVRSSFETGIELRRTSADFFDRNKERSDSLTGQNAISKQQLDQLDTEAQVAELQVRQERDNQRLAKLEYRRAQEALRRRAIKSPIDGVVVERYKAVGEYVEDTAIMRVAQLNPLHVETIVPVTYMGQITTGMQARVTPAVPGQDSQFAVVSRIDRVADAASGTFGVRLTLDNPAGEIATGVRCALQFDQTLPVVVAQEDKRSMPHTTKVNSTPTVAVTKTGHNKPILPIVTMNTGKKKSIPAIATTNTGGMNPTPSVAATHRGYKHPAHTSTAAMSSTHDDAVSSSSQCFEAGPIDKHSTADKLMERLINAGINDTKLREIPGEFPGQFFVLTEKMKNLEAGRALVVEMAAKGITETQLLKRGSHAQKISLGLFSNRELAQRHLEALAAKGIAAHVVPRNASTLFLDVASREQQDVDSLRQVLGAAAPKRIEAVPCATLQARVN